MLLDNLGEKHFSDTDLENIHQDLNRLTTTITKYASGLTPLERKKYSKIGEQNKLLVNKVKQYHESQPDLQSPDVDWEEFQKDYRDREQAWAILIKIKTLQEMVMGIKVVHDFDNYSEALRDYQYAKYMNRFADHSGFANKIDNLKVFFPNTGKTKKK